MGLSENFNLFCNRISINTEQREEISYRYKRITRQLNLDSRELDSDQANSFYVGSYGRGTAINTVSDIDMVYVLPKGLYARYNQYSGNKQSTFLQVIKNSIKKTYPKTDIKADGQIISIPFDSGVPFELLPVFENENGGYIFANSNQGGCWKITNPKPEIECIKRVDASCNGNLRSLCRMMRIWKNYWNVPISGLLIDTLAYQFIQNWEWRAQSFFYYDWLSRDFFKFLATQDAQQEYWRSPGSNQYAWGSGFQYKANQCYKLAQLAIIHSTDGQEWSAKKTWREIYGSKYPE